MADLLLLQSSRCVLLLPKSILISPPPIPVLQTPFLTLNKHNNKMKMKKKMMSCFALQYSTEKHQEENNNMIMGDHHRPFHFPPNMWGDRFLTLPFHISELETCSTQVEALKETVKDMLMASTTHPIHNIFLINTLYRLGVSYHFDTEIHNQLTHRFDTLSQLIHHDDYDLHTIAIIFQVFRSYGFNISSDVFNKFKDENGEFKVVDLKGMISLYEAAAFRINGEPILDEAFAFTASRLKSMASQLTPHYTAEYIENALRRPYHKGVPRLEARQFIRFYEKENEESKNDTLLKFAKFDFNRIQMMLQQELRDLCSWWKGKNIESRMPYVRHRIVEAFFLAVALYFEPRYARARNIYANHASILGFLDDTYDAYGTYEELQCLTDAMQRFDISAMDQLPNDNLKHVYEIILKVYHEDEEKLRKEGRSYAISYTKNEFKEVAITYLDQALWVETSYEPTFDEYLQTALKSSASILTLFQAFIGMEEADETAYRWLLNNDHHKIRKTINILGRLYDDLATNEDEEKRGLVCGTSCYMKQYGVTRQEAIEAYNEMIEAAWKDLNEARLKPKTAVSNQIMMRALNFARFLDVVYKTEDGLTRPEISLKDSISNMLIHPIPL